jgi:uncharacterized phiE125 gp8 family phage protein
MPTTLRPLNPPTALPVSLATAKLHCKVDHSADDALITSMIRAAARSAEQQLNRALMEQQWLCSLDEFPATGIVLGKPRVIAIASIIYTNPAGTDVTLPGSAYTLDADALPGLVLPALGTTWPATSAQPNAVRVTFTAGYGADAAAVPDDVAVWLLLQVATLYRNREAFTQGVSVAELPGRFADGLLDAQRLYW